MRSARSSLFLAAFLAFEISFMATGFAVETSPPVQVVSELSGIKTRLAVVEKTQQEILAQKDKILAEIDRLRVQVRHSGGNSPKKK